MRRRRKHIFEYDVARWAENFLDALDRSHGVRRDQVIDLSGAGVQQARFPAPVGLGRLPHQPQGHLPPLRGVDRREAIDEVDPPPPQPQLEGLASLGAELGVDGGCFCDGLVDGRMSGGMTGRHRRLAFLGSVGTSWTAYGKRLHRVSRPGRPQRVDTAGQDRTHDCPPTGAWRPCCDLAQRPVHHRLWAKPGAGSAHRSEGRPPGAELSLIHISEPTRLLSISYAVFCLKKKTRQRDTR